VCVILVFAADALNHNHMVPTITNRQPK
jgi:hypothetical protein